MLRLHILHSRYHMLNAHGIVHATGREFPLPTDIRILDNRSREAFCQYCHRMVAAYSTRSKAPTSPWAPWYRHCNNVIYLLSFRVLSVDQVFTDFPLHSAIRK